MSVKSTMGDISGAKSDFPKAVQLKPEAEEFIKKKGYSMDGTKRND
jgi:hypothetical protein